MVSGRLRIRSPRPRLHHRATRHGIHHFFQAANLDFPSNHTQIRMLLKGINRLDQPVRHKAPVSLHLLDKCFESLNMLRPSDQALWGSLFLLPAASVGDCIFGQEIRLKMSAFLTVTVPLQYVLKKLRPSTFD
ncbi:hypothetical protein GQ600_3896 [Phytophthora cactorum]|nr:hypothetical protein GQ600_3896 [Phytophthora cactorum]